MWEEESDTHEKGCKINRMEIDIDFLYTDVGNIILAVLLRLTYRGINIYYSEIVLFMYFDLVD